MIPAFSISVPSRRPPESGSMEKARSSRRLPSHHVDRSLAPTLTRDAKKTPYGRFAIAIAGAAAAFFIAEYAMHRDPPPPVQTIVAPSFAAAPTETVEPATPGTMPPIRGVASSVVNGSVPDLRRRPSPASSASTNKAKRPPAAAPSSAGASAPAPSASVVSAAGGRAPLRPIETKNPFGAP
jgi:hypothetical protein